MSTKSVLCTACAILWLAADPVAVWGQEKLDYEVIDRIRDEGFRRSQVMDLASWMSDVYGPRLAHSPSYNQAAEWAKKKLEEFGLDNVALEAWGELGVGWENRYTSVHMLTPQYMPMIGYAKPWTRGTNGKTAASVVFLNAEEIYDENDLAPYKGKLQGKIVFVAPARRLELNFRPDAVRLSDEELEDMATLQITRKAQDQRQPAGKEPLDREQVRAFLDAEGAIAMVSPGMGTPEGPMDKGTVRVSGEAPLPRGASPPLTSLIVAAEHYNRILRVLEKGLDVRMEVEIRNTFYEDELLDYNVIAEIPGTDLKDEIVMLGGHYDAEPAGTGATDNAAGAAAVMEAMRILVAVGARPRRTIRAALWGAEETGLRGSRGYVKKHFGDPETEERLPGHDKLSVYFNMDWYGRFRGIYLQGNDRARPIFEAWMRPFHDVGMTYLVPGNTGSTDHMAFLEVGLPGFQFIQDDLEFFTTTFHTNMDFYDRLVADDLMQAAVILASFSYHAAMRDEKFPRPKTMDNGRRWHK